MTAKRRHESADLAEELAVRSRPTTRRMPRSSRDARARPARTPAPRRRARRTTSRSSPPGAAGSTRARSRSRSWPASCSSCSPRAPPRSGRRRCSWRTSMLLFGNSALYHRFDWGPKTKAVLKRIDHANIFLLIAGTYTPIAVLALPPDKGWLLLVARLGRRAPRHPASASSGSTRRAGCTSRSTCCSAGPR